MANLKAVVHWLPDAPLRTSAIRAPGKVANTFAVESFTDEVAALARVDPVEFRQKRLANPRGIEGLKRVAARMNWQPRPSPAPIDRTAAVLTGRGIACCITRTRRRWWRWGWRWRWSGPPGASG